MTSNPHGETGHAFPLLRLGASRFHACVARPTRHSRNSSMGVTIPVKPDTAGPTLRTGTGGPTPWRRWCAARPVGLHGKTSLKYRHYRRAPQLLEIAFSVNRQGQMLVPPSTAMSAPVMNAVSEEARKATMLAISTVLPNLPIEVRERMKSALGPSAGFMSVSIGPGAIWLTVIPRPARSRASPLVSPVMAALVIA